MNTYKGIVNFRRGTPYIQLREDIPLAKGTRVLVVEDAQSIPLAQVIRLVTLAYMESNPCASLASWQKSKAYAALKELEGK